MGGDTVTVHDATQWPAYAQATIAGVLGIEPAAVRVHAPYVGGAFGAGLFVWQHVILTVLAARAVGRPVKLVLTRPEMFTGIGHRPSSVQTIRMGARRDDEGDVLSVVMDAVVLQGRRRSEAQQPERGGRELWGRLVGDDGEDSCCRASGSVVDLGDAAGRDGAAHERRVCEIRVGDVGRVGRGTAYLGRAVDPVDTGTDDRGHLATVSSVRTIVRLASSTLNAVPGTV